MRDKQNINMIEGQEQEIKDHFHKDIEILVYRSFKGSNQYNNKEFEGTITKEFYKNLQTLDKKKNIHLVSQWII
jgi:hypothetical protein